MAGDLRIAVQTADFDVAGEYQWLRGSGVASSGVSVRGENGAVVTFTGLVRELAEGELVGMSLEHYPAMTERALTDIVRQAQQRWALGRVAIIHRVGFLTLNEQIVFVGVASAHRKAAANAAEFIMDYLKTRAPFWKKEHRTDGAEWVAAKDSDAQATEQWEQDNA
ncbi:molybdopterin synthase catalytic subunit MoaE [Aliidiomarina sp.]|uniref:molybdopterin synthase catalytic subunit MoaE n=1 Tax=Aliidiomarina sp. TaxID=1872439 RepID=UPI003A4DCD51